MTQEWAFEMTSEGFGSEVFDGYDSREEAVAGIDRVKLKSAFLNDGVVRKYELGTIEWVNGDREFVGEGDIDASPLPVQVKVFTRPVEGSTAIASFVSTEELSTDAFVQKLFSACTDWLAESGEEWVGNFNIADLFLFLPDDGLNHSLLRRGIASLDVRLFNDPTQLIGYDTPLASDQITEEAMKHTKIFSRGTEATIAVVSFEASDYISDDDFVVALRAACSAWIKDFKVEGSWNDDFNIGDVYSLACDSNGCPSGELALKLNQNGIKGLEIQIFQGDNFIDYDTVLE